MSDHNSAVFNNACRKVPRDPLSQSPSPMYEHKFVSNFHNENVKMDTKNNSKSKSLTADKVILKSFIEFYDSIPEYDEINHLSNKDFYRKLDNLKEKQRVFYKYIQDDQKYKTKATSWIEDYKQLNIKDSNNQKNLKSIQKQTRLKQEEAFSDNEVPKPPSRRSVRIESPSDKSDISFLQNTRRKAIANVSSASPKYFDKSNGSCNESAWDDASVNDFRLDSNRDLPLTIRSAPTSPVKPKFEESWKSDGVTIPKPFQMTVRDEENQIIEEVLAKTPKPKEDAPELFRANPVPIESRIPLFNQIVAEQEKRSEIVKRKRKESLKAQMRPFSFTRREEEMQVLNKDMSKSSPSIFLDDTPIKVKQFKAKPIPKGLFSDYVYQKMHEDEFYRSLQKKIRAEEMLHRSSLPPSMAKREKIKPKTIICPRSFKGLESESTNNSSLALKYKDDNFITELDLKTNSMDSPNSCKSIILQRIIERRQKQSYGSGRNSSGSSRNAENYKANCAVDLLSVNKSNLAAVLRIKTAKKKMQMEMYKKLEEARIREESRWREKVLRKKPAWQSLVYSHEEDLAMRLQLRRDEEKLRNEEHRHRMELMYGRVNRMPMLFERQSQYKQSPVSRKDLIAKLNEDYNKYLSSSSLSLSEDLDALDYLSKEVVQSKHNEKEKCDLP